MAIHKPFRKAFFHTTLSALFVLLVCASALALPAGGAEREKDSLIDDVGFPPSGLGDLECGQSFYVQPGESYDDTRTRMQLLSNAGEVEATRYLAYCYLYGIGGETDMENGMALLRKAAENGSPLAQMDLAVMLAVIHDFHASPGTELREVGRWYEEAARNPRSSRLIKSQASFALGQLFETTPEIYGGDLNKALSWYEQGGGADGHFYTGLLYARNQDLPEAYAKAYANLEEAAQGGVRQAFAQLANLSLMRRTSSASSAYIDAYAWFCLACESAWTEEKAFLEAECAALRERMSPEDTRRAEQKAQTWRTAHPAAFTTN